MEKDRTPIDELIKKFKSTRDDSIRNRILERLLPIVKYTAERIAARLPHNVSAEELLSAGVLGSIEAIESFDAGRGTKFENFCINRVRGAMLDELRNMDWVPRLVRARVQNLENTYMRLEMKLGRAPTDVEMARELGVNLKTYDHLLKEAGAAAMLSLSKERQEKEDDEPVTGADIITEGRADFSPDEQSRRNELFEFIKERLPEKERLVLMLYYNEELTMKEIGEALDLSESRVCQIHARAVMKLKNKLRYHKADFL